MPADLLTIPRDPGQPPLTLRFMQQVQQLLNDLLRRGELVRHPSGQWTLVSEDLIIAHQVFGK